MLEEEHMENKIVCPRCRQKFPLPSTYTERVICPHCGLENPNLRKRSSSGNSLKEQLKKILRDSPKKPVDSGSSLAKRPSFFALDQKPGVSAPKRAVLCGVTYKNRKFKLKGTINDVFKMKDLLTELCGFEDQNILVLTEEQKDMRLIPTKVNIENCLRWLVKDCRCGDSLVFYYSGHGLRQPDFYHDEHDGFNETICPVDFLWGKR